jgi:hypothetical protein
MHSFSGRAIAVACAVLFLAAPAAADFSIQPVSEPADFQTVSPDSKVAQFARLLDSEGDPVNESRLDSLEDLRFRYRYNGTPNRMDYISDGYYYATFHSNSTGRIVKYELQDTSATSGSEVNLTEDLEAGMLDVDILTDFSGSEKAGDLITVDAEVTNEMQYYAVDTDDSGGVSDGDEFVVDRGGSGTFSEGADLLMAGNTPENGQSLSSSNPWSSVDHPIMVNDSADGDSWDGSNDIIVLDYNDGETVSTGADEVINSGNNQGADTSAGVSLEKVSSVSGSIYFVSSDNQLDPGEEIIYDNDSDGMFTRNADQVIAGNTPNPGTSITYTDSIGSSLKVSSYDANSGDSWDDSVDVLARDFDNDGEYSARPGGDNVMNGTAPDEGAVLDGNGVGDWEKSGTDTGTEGEIEVYDEVADDGWDPTSDAIWLESGDSAGFDPGQDEVIAGNPQDGMRGTENNNRLGQWETVAAYNGDGDCCFNFSTDAIIRDWHGGGTFSTREDIVIAGSVTGPIDAGTSYDQIDGFDDDWGLDVIDSTQGGAWSSNQDTILKDRNNGGTYSASADTVINSGGSIDSSGGTSIYQLNAYVGEWMAYSDLDEDGSYSPGDEIFRDLDHDNQYTARADKHLAGISLSTAGAARGLEDGNPWSGSSEPLMFYDAESTGEWNSSTDSLVQDLDEDGVYTAFEDRIVSDEEGEIMAESGDELISTDRTNFPTPEITIRFSNGSMTTEPVELGLKPDGDYTNTVEIPDVPGSTFLVQVRGETAISDLEGTESAVMSTRKRGIGFSSNSSVEISPKRAGQHTLNVTLENFLDEENRIELNISDSLENMTEAPESVTIPASGTEEVELEFNLTPVDSHSGHVTFIENETGMTDETEIDINGPSCELQTSRICLDSSVISVVAAERENITRELKIESIWKSDESIDVEASVRGGISSYVTANTTSMEFTDSETIGLTFEPSENGDFSGNLLLETGGQQVEVDLELESNVQQLDSGLAVTPNSVDLGTVPQDSDQSFYIEIENTGTLEITDMNVSSEQLSLSSEIGDTLSVGDTQNFSVTSESMSSEKGTVTINGQTSESTVSASVEVSSSFVKPLSQMKEDVNSKISSLRSQASSSELQTQLTNLATKTNSIETQWQKGNYDQANSIYDSTMTSLNSVESQISSSPSPGTGTGGSDDQQSSESPDSSTGGGGGGGAIIIVAVLLLLILGAGFVLYTSYYPEEGDPLYDVLGDRE